MKATKSPVYIIKLKETFENYPEASKHLKRTLPEEIYEVSYIIPCPSYKSWVPNWLLRLIIKK